MAKSKIGGGRLVPLPFTTFGEIGALGLEVHAYCTKCHSSRGIDIEDDRLRNRQFAGARFSCQATWIDGEACGGFGAPTVRPPVLIPVGGEITLAFLYCLTCLPPWQIDQVQLDQPPWSLANLQPGGRFRCPGCGGRSRGTFMVGLGGLATATTRREEEPGEMYDDPALAVVFRAMIDEALAS